ncbi:MAG: hypothetical protein KDC98_21805 [Planctomycetes bacterium]|nr:hypothetical protein [Planctomycetota bacterium]
MRFLSTLFVLAISSPLSAQANDWAGISVTCQGSATASARDIACGSQFSCTTLPVTCLRGDTVSYFVMGQLNGFYALLGTVDIAGLGCVNLGVPGLVNSLILPGGSLVPLAVGVCSVPDNGRCNGGASPFTLAFTIPAALPPGALALQAVASCPWSGGGNGLAFTRAVEVIYN